MGLIDGVLATRAGWLAKREVVEVKYDPKTITYADLVEKAKRAKCATPVFARSDEQLRAAKSIVGKKALRSDDALRYEDKDTRHYLKKTPLRFVPMVEAQSARANALLGTSRDRRARLGRAMVVLSPSQLELLEFVMRHPKADWPSAVGREFRAAWHGADKVRQECAGKRKP